MAGKLDRDLERAKALVGRSEYRRARGILKRIVEDPRCPPERGAHAVSLLKLVLQLLGEAEELRGILGSWIDRLEACRPGAGPELVEAILAATECDLDLGELDVARENLGRLEAEALSSEHEAHRTFLMGRLDLLDGSRFEAGRRRFCRAIKLLGRTGHDLHRARFKTLLGVAYAGLKRMTAARAILRSAKRHIDRLDPATPEVRLRAALLNLTLGDLFRDTGDYQAALSNYRASYELADALNARPLLRNFFNRVGTLHYLLGRHAEAIACHLDRQNLAALRRTGGKHFLFFPYYNAARCSFEMGKISEAEKHLRRAKGYAVATNSPRLLAYATLLEGDVARRKHRYADAARLLDRADALFAGVGEDGDKRGICEVLLGRCELHLARRNQDACLEAAARCAELAVAGRFSDLQARCLLLQSKVLYARRGGLDALYDEVFKHLHVVTSPVVLFKILSNLYFYSFKFDDRYPEAYLWSRIDNLKAVLDNPVYSDLYYEFITNRFLNLIAARFGRPGDDPDLEDGLPRGGR